MKLVIAIPVYAVYTGFYNAACEFTLDGLVSSYP